MDAQLPEGYDCSNRTHAIMTLEPKARAHCVRHSIARWNTPCVNRRVSQLRPLTDHQVMIGGRTIMLRRVSL